MRPARSQDLPVAWPAAALRSLTAYPELVPGLLAIGVFLAWAASEGGFEPTSSNPGGLFLFGLALATGYAFRTQLRDLPRASLVAVGLAIAFAAWTFLSIAWADVKGVAWAGANRTLLYASVIALFSIPAWRPRSGAILMGVFTFGLAVVGLVYFLTEAAAADPGLSFVDDRFSEPTGYHNATSALFLEAVWAGVFLASRREVPWPLRGLLLGAAGVLVELALVPQSRGSAIVFPIVALLYLAVMPGRLRLLIVIVPLAAAAALSASTLLDVYSTTGAGGDVPAAMGSARTALLISFAALVAAGSAIGLADRSIRVSDRATRLGARAVGATASVAAMVGVVLIIGVIGSPVSWANDRWQDFKGGQASSESLSDSRFGGSLGSNRYDFWRVAVNQFEDAPLQGAGIDNFAVDYVRERESGEEPLHPHSLPQKILSQTGLVGTALFIGLLALLAQGAARVRIRTAEGLTGGLAGAALIVAAYWLLHSSGDWFWALPALSAPPLAWLAMTARLRAGETTSDRHPGRDEGPRRTLAYRLAPIAIAILGAFAIATYALPWAAARDVEEATRIWDSNPPAAFDRLERASDVNFLSDSPDLVAGAIAARIGDRQRMRESFTRALDRNPFSWYALLELGALDALQGRRGPARAELRKALALSPLDPTIRFVSRKVARGQSVSLAEIRRQLLDRVCQRLGRSEERPNCRR